MSRRRLLFTIHATHLLVALFFVNCHAKTNHHCHSPSSCGNISNITYPFRLQGDPENCGNKNFELACDQNNRTMLERSYGKFYVQAINYDNHTIRVVDVGIQKGNCSSLPLNSLWSRNVDYLWSSRYSSIYPFFVITTVEFVVAVFIDCEKPVNSPLYTDATASNCVKKVNSSNSSVSSTSKRHSYFLFGELLVSDVADLCRIEEIVLETCWQPPAGKSGRIISFSDFHNQLAYGFELSWGCQVGAKYLDICPDGCHQFTNSALLCWLLLIIFRVLELIYYHYYIVYGFIITGFYLAARYVCGMLCLFAFLIYKFRRRHLSMFDAIESFLQSHDNSLVPIRYSYSQIKKMTKGFKDELGKGGYGCVYKGKLRSGSAAAIKILGKSKANGQEFINEVATIGRIHHVNVVQLIGFCTTRSKRALVYEFMPNGSLEKYIFSHEEKLSLNCKQMYGISVGVARGIEYLHRGCDMQILHFDIKPHNILLDENFTPKVSDFGLAKLYPTDNSIVTLTGARGTMGYMAPELFYQNIGRVSYKADVYSYGMLLMEMTGRRRNLDPFADHMSQIYFPCWVYDQFKEGRDVDMGETTEEEKQMVRKMIITALWCIQMKPGDRPSMHQVVEMLEGNIELLQMPPKPFLTPQEMSAEDQ